MATANGAHTDRVVVMGGTYASASTPLTAQYFNQPVNLFYANPVTDWVNWQWVAPYPGNVVALTSYCDFNSLAGSCEVRLMKNGATTGLFTTHPAGDTSNQYFVPSTVGAAVPFVAGDYFRILVLNKSVSQANAVYLSSSLMVEFTG